MKKIILILLGASLAASLFFFNTSSAQVKEEERLSDVIDSAWNEYHVLASSVLSDDLVLFFEIADKVNEVEFRNNIRESLDEHNLEKYSLDIKQSSVEEKEIDHTMEKVEVAISNYLQEKGYEGIYAQYSNDFKPTINLNVSKNTNISDIELKAKVEEFLGSKEISPHLKDLKEIPYVIQINSL